MLALYAAFLPRCFIGDDWFWLEHAQRVAIHPALCFERTPYGYLRPTFALFLSAVYRVCGAEAVRFGIVNVLLHSLNVWLFWRLLVRCGFPPVARRIAVFGFAFYFLCAPVVCWISAGADLLVLAFLLLFSQVLVAYHGTFSWPRLLLLGILGVLATTSIETGWMCVGLVFLHAWAVHRNPFRGRYLVGSLVLTVVFAAYLAFYFSTRSVVDKPLAVGFRFPESLWYLYSYLFMPLSKRLVTDPGTAWLHFLTALRGAGTLLLAVLFYRVWRRATPAARYIVMMPFVLLVPITATQGGIRLFDLYPDATVSRFMYVAIPGAAALIGLGVEDWKDRVALRFLPVLAAGAIVVVADVAGIRAVTGMYFQQQRVAKLVFAAFSQPQSIDCARIVVECGPGCDPASLGTPATLAAQFKVASGHSVEVVVRTAGAAAPSHRDACRLRWVGDAGRFALETAPAQAP